MIGRSIIPIVIDTDNALSGLQSQFLPGDIDDAFAISYLLASVPIEAIYSVGGNATAEVCHQNNLELCQVLQSKVKCIPGLNNKNFDISPNIVVPGNCENYLSLGPLTNLCYFLKHNFSTARIWMTLGRIKTMGLFPPLWPMEFNATQNVAALLSVLQSDIPKTIVPLDVAIQLRFQKEMSIMLKQSVVGKYLLFRIRRWQLRNLLLKGSSHFPVWDLVSAMALVNPMTCKINRGVGYVFENGLFLCDINNLPQTFHNRKKAIFSTEIEIVTAIDSEMIWKCFFKALQNPEVNPFLLQR